MTPKYRQFIFEACVFDKAARTLALHYSFDFVVPFTETIHFDFDFTDYDPKSLDIACQILFLMAGVSYYKAYLAPEIVIKKGQLDAVGADFFAKTYQRGLGEFFYVNQLDPRTPIPFVANAGQIEQPSSTQKNEGLLIGIGGGKDSLVTVELLRNRLDNLATWSLDHRPQLTPLVEATGLPHLWLERQWDRSLLDHNAKGALNGHVPISAIWACVGAVAAILSGRRDIVVSNEQSANDPTLQYQGVDINHQYSKSEEFERDFQAYLKHTLGDQVRYYSFLRPLSEVRIAEIFAHVGFEKYKSTFSSCNRAFIHTSDRMTWCGQCPKCAFIFMALTPFLPRTEIEAIWHGKNLLLDPHLEPAYRKLLGIEGDKPLDCVGDVRESREAMHLAFNQYPELAAKYTFDLPADYDYRAMGGHAMPPEIYEQFQQSLRLQGFSNSKIRS